MLELVNPNFKLSDAYTDVSGKQIGGALGGFYFARVLSSMWESLLGRWETGANLATRFGVTGFNLISAAITLMGGRILVNGVNIDNELKTSMMAGLYVSAAHTVISPLIHGIAPQSIWMQRMTGITTIAPAPEQQQQQQQQQLAGYNRSDLGGRFSAVSGPRYRRLGNVLTHRGRTAAMNAIA